MTRSSCIVCGIPLESKRGHKKKMCQRCHRAKWREIYSYQGYGGENMRRKPKPPVISRTIVEHSTLGSATRCRIDMPILDYIV